jgi:hypothetical protein
MSSQSQRHEVAKGRVKGLSECIKAGGRLDIVMPEPPPARDQRVLDAQRYRLEISQLREQLREPKLPKVKADALRQDLKFFLQGLNFLTLSATRAA